MQDGEKMRILIAGYGNIGRHIHKELSVHFTPNIYDKYIDQYKATDLTGYDIGFICVPTDSLCDGGCDISNVEECVKNIEAKLIIIKSSIPVGTTDMLIAKYGKRIIMSPEYYGTTQHSSDSPNFLVLGGELNDCKQVAQLYYQLKDGSFKIAFTTAKTAELAKYMENCFLALKVVFCNEFAQIAKAYGISYEILREIFVLDPRMGNSHTFVFEEQPYYDSHCLNKDIPALIKMAHGKALLIDAMCKINSERKEHFLRVQEEGHIDNGL